MLGMRSLLLSIFLHCAAVALGQSTGPVAPREITADSAAQREVLPLRTLPGRADFTGEDLLYSVRYGFIEAGEARLTVTAGPDYGGRSTWKVTGTGRSTGALDWVFRVRDHYESHIDKAGLFPHHFTRRVREGGYRLERDIAFDPVRRTAATTQNGRTRHHVMPAFVQDLVSAFYCARRLPLNRMHPGEVIDIPTIIDGKIHTLRARFVGPRSVDVKAGTFEGLAFAPIVQKGRIWKDADDLTVIVSADDRHLPVLIESNLVIGSIRLELVEDRSVLEGAQAASIGP